MKSDLQLRVQAYLDNELTPGEARHMATLLTSDTEARDLYAELKQTKEVVRGNEPELRLNESRDFYWSKIQRQIATVEREPQRAPTPWWMRFMVPVAGAVALFAILLSVVRPDRVTRSTASARPVASEPGGPLHQGEVMAPEMSAITFRSQLDKDESVTLVWLASDSPETSTLSWFDLFD